MTSRQSTAAAAGARQRNESSFTERSVLEERTASQPIDPPTRHILLGILLLLGAGFLYIARDLLLTISVALLLALVLGPVVRSLARRGVPAPISASTLVLLLLFGFTTIGYLLSGPIASIVADAPRIGLEIQAKFGVLQRVIESISHATDQIEAIVTPPNGDERVVVDGGNEQAIGYLATDATQRLVAVTFSLVLLLFILASGDLFQEKLVKVLPTLSDKKLGLRIVRDVEREVSRYLLIVTLINAGLGAVIGVAFWLIGMPSPLLWGLAAALANYLPYVGTALVAIACFGIAVVAFDTVGQAMLPLLVVIAISVAEGYVVTPMIVGHRHALNAVVIIVSVAFWGWLWGVIGALIAVPMLVTAKVFADNVEGFHSFGEFLSARHLPEAPEDDGSP